MKGKRMENEKKEWEVKKGKNGRKLVKRKARKKGEDGSQ